jgi:TfoX/Sxy family transcriptional regulator of competence genes
LYGATGLSATDTAPVDPRTGRNSSPSAEPSRDGVDAGDNSRVAYDEDLANRLRELVLTEDGVAEQRMFGGLAFLINGNMSVSASGQGGLLLRVDPAETDALLRRPHVQPFEMRGRVMQGWLRVDPAGLRTKRQLERWVALGVAYARSLPSKR